jgi:ABC-type Fe3+ transport system substrate-binding protein
MTRMRSLLIQGLVFAAIALCGAVDAGAVQTELIDAARKEGVVVWYTSFVENQAARPLAAAFEKKYPGVKVQLVAGTAGDLLSKLLAETRAGSIRADVHHGGSSVWPLFKAGALQNYKAEEAAGYPADLREANGIWTADALYFLVPAINTEMVTDAQAPHNLQDLLDPKWRGKIAWTTQMTQGGAPGFIGTILQSMGEQAGMDYLRKLASQKIVNVPANQRVVLDQVIGGEYPIALATFINHSAISQRDGAPVKALTLDPATETIDTLMLLKGPHPNAGKLFIEFLLSQEGQEVFSKAGYIPARPNVPAVPATLKPEGGHFRAEVLSPEIVEANMARWIVVYNELFK